MGFETRQAGLCFSALKYNRHLNSKPLVFHHWDGNNNNSDSNSSNNNNYYYNQLHLQSIISKTELIIHPKGPGPKTPYECLFLLMPSPMPSLIWPDSTRPTCCSNIKVYSNHGDMWLFTPNKHLFNRTDVGVLWIQVYFVRFEMKLKKWGRGTSFMVTVRVSDSANL